MEPRRLAWTTLLALLMSAPRVVVAQSVRGVVLDPVGAPVVGAAVHLTDYRDSIVSRSVTNERGEFGLVASVGGEYRVRAMRVGFQATISSPLTMVPGQELVHRLVMSPVTTLDTISVRETGILPEFEDHRRLGLGRFLTRADLEKLQGRQLAVALRQLSGVSLAEARGHAWVQSKRQSMSISSINANARSDRDPTVWCPKDGEGFGSAGAKCGCYARVYLDNQLMNPGRAPEPFDINSIVPESVEAVEWYSSPAQTPAKYSTLNSVCGVLVIHTRRSR